MQTCINVIKTRAGMVEQNHLFIGPDKAQVTTKAEEKFLELCSTITKDWADLDQKDKEIMIEIGSTYGGGYEVCINWPEVEEVNAL